MNIKKSDINRPHAVNGNFDQNFHASPIAGCVLIERVMRRMNIMKILKTKLPERSDRCRYSTHEILYSMIASALAGGRGITGIEYLRHDEIACRIFGLEKGAPSPATVNRVLCELSGLSERSFDEAYSKVENVQLRMKFDGTERPVPKMRRVVPSEPEAAKTENLETLNEFLRTMAKRCTKSLTVNSMRLHGWNVVFGDGTDLSVEGTCFDAAQRGRDGELIFRLMALMLGPVYIGQALLPGNRDEGKEIPALIRDSKKTVRDIIGPKGKVLALMDAAYFERPVVEMLKKNGWDYIICANQNRGKLKKIVESQPKIVWRETGADSRRGWRRSQVCTYVHSLAGWAEPVTIVCRRWEKEGDIPGVWQYSFLGTSIEPENLPKKLNTRLGYAKSIWALYSTKQGRENHFKTALIDLGLHHPPSSRLGVNQAYYTIMLAASNIAMVMRYRVMPEKHHGMHLWRIRETYIMIAGYLKTKARTLIVNLAGGNTPLWMQNLWRQAFTKAKRL